MTELYTLSYKKCTLGNLQKKSVLIQTITHNWKFWHMLSLKERESEFFLKIKGKGNIYTVLPCLLHPSPKHETDKKSFRLLYYISILYINDKERNKNWLGVWKTPQRSNHFEQVTLPKPTSSNTLAKPTARYSDVLEKLTVKITKCFWKKSPFLKFLKDESFEF